MIEMNDKQIDEYTSYLDSQIFYGLMISPKMEKFHKIGGKAVLKCEEHSCILMKTRWNAIKIWRLKKLWKKIQETYKYRKMLER